MHTDQYFVLHAAQELRDARGYPGLEHLQVHLAHVHLACAQAAAVSRQPAREAEPCNPRACNTRACALPAPPAALQRRRGQCGVRAFWSSSGGYLGSASFLTGPSAIVFREKGCRWCCPACCDMAARASAAGLSHKPRPLAATRQERGDGRAAMGTKDPSFTPFTLGLFLFSSERKRGADVRA
jgi:hypothetical protein